EHVGDGFVEEVSCFYGSDRAGHVDLSHRTITNHHDRVYVGVRYGEYDGAGLIRIDLPGTISYHGKNQFGIAVDLDAVTSVVIGGRSFFFSFYGNGNAGKRLPTVVKYTASPCPGLSHEGPAIHGEE